jgi:hypothetical protein
MYRQKTRLKISILHLQEKLYDQHFRRRAYHIIPKRTCLCEIILESICFDSGNRCD